MKILYAAKTDLGLKRTLNEDNFAVLASQNLFTVADGMGGHAAGEVASKIAVETMKEFITVANQDDEITWPFDINLNLPEEANQLETAIKLANNRIYQTALEQQKLEGMGTTVVGLLYKNGIAFIGHVGDSRAYLLRGDLLKPLTFDHSWVNVQVMLGEISKEEAKKHPMKNIITRALGTKENVEVDLQTEVIQDKDTIILCSDGLSGLMDDDTMKEILMQYDDNLDKAADRLIELANENGGDDNITLIIVKFFAEEGDKEVPPHSTLATKNFSREEEITEVILHKDIKDSLELGLQNEETAPLNRDEILDDDTLNESAKVRETLEEFERTMGSGGDEEQPPMEDEEEKQ